MNFSPDIPLTLYVHLPWCVRKCPYCDFNSHENGRILTQESAYLDALTRDLDWVLPRIKGRAINSIFIGGGTPSLFSAAAIQRLLIEARARLELAPDAEVTLEANPGTAEAGKFQGFREAGVNRLSLGVQSFNDGMLQRLGRIHNAGEAMNAVRMARSAGFQNFNLDIMFGLPEQSCAAALSDLQIALDEVPAHISWYQLTIEPNTVFYARPPRLPDEDLVWHMQKEGQRLLAAHGYRQYEISAYARPGRECAHNLNYWQFGDYLGIGAGAHSKLTDSGAGRISRCARHRLPERYLALGGTDAAVTERKHLDANDIPLEFMMNALRLNEGVPASWFPQRTGMALGAVEQQLRLARDRDLLVRDEQRLQPTAQGRRYLNDLLQIFMTGEIDGRPKPAQ